MSEQKLDLRRSMRVIRRHWKVVTAVTVLGALAGAGYTELRPPLKEANAIVVISSSKETATQVVIASDTQVLLNARSAVGLQVSLQTLRKRVQVTKLTPNSLTIGAEATTAQEAETIANAVANSYVQYLDANQAVLGKITAHLLQRATGASGASVASRMTLTAILGGLVGLILGAIIALASSIGDRRLQLRDEIADALGIAVLAGMPVWHPSDAARWTKLLNEYQPSTAHAWRLRNALQYLGVAEQAAAQADGSAPFSLTVLSLSSDRRALALGPQLAAFAASLGIPTALVIGPQYDGNAASTLRAACAAYQPIGRLWAGVAEHGKLEVPGNARLAVVVTVVDSRKPQVAGTLRTNATVLGVTAGVATAEQLANVAANAADDRRLIEGILVADPDRADQTTGRIPQLVRPTHRMPPTRTTGMTTETKR